MKFNPNEALGLPKASVRALLALTVVVAFVVVAVTTTSVADLKELALVAMAFYFLKSATTQG